MKQQLEEIRRQALAALESASASAELEDLRVRFLGKKGELTAVLKQMGKLSADDRPVMGQIANDVREAITAGLEEKMRELEARALELRMMTEAIDVTIPGKAPVEPGHRHPLSIIFDEVKAIFIGMGFEIVEGPEIELSEYNFTKLNTSEGHPARDPQDTFYTTDDCEVCLRTQTSPLQVRAMETRPLPIRIIAPGRVYRKDEVDATHSPMFHQLEGLVIDKGITMSDLKGSLQQMVRGLYGDNAQVRFRPHHFPFTEPSCEVDVMCFNCHGAGCRTCKGEGWIELLGAGMVHPNVLEGCGIDPSVYSGFAFGVGVERLAMRRFNISDMRLLFENDLRFLSQF